ncbi:MAG TPA: LpqB family beta-propeller domain-containing protein [Candidatus Sulfopaludibacter sp.]|jgi:Tol biopolymer transport system component|nr:LpqB family beta-propeller domain-containing protein [Candidatus Sulfopaludibacter sp.]
MASGTLVRRPAVLLAFALCAVGGVVTLLGRLAGGPAVEIKKTALTSEAGAHAYPSFSPDGSRVAYSEHDSSKDAVFHIYVRPVVGGTPLQVTNGEGSDIGPVWSPDGGSLAFLRLVEDQAQVIVVAAAGGTERKVVQFDAPTSEDEDVEVSPSVSWSRDGKTLVVSAPAGDQHVPAISTVPAEGGALTALTKPAEDSRGDTNPAVSPDGKSIAFVRKLDSQRSDIYLCDMKGGAVRQLTFDGNGIRGIAWNPGGQDLMYSSNRGQGWRLWRVPAYGGSPRDLLVSGNHATYPSVAMKGSRLAFTESPSVSEVWIAQIGALDPEHERPLLRSSGRERNPAFSPDGKRVADISDQSGDQEIWITEADGTRTQITRLEGRRMTSPAWSPDGKMLLVVAHGQNGPEVFTVPAAGGKTTRVLTDANDASWSHDGKAIYYSSRMGGEIWKVAADGTNPVEITKMHAGGNDPHESADGKYVYYRSRRSIWRAPSEGGEGEEAFVPEHDLMWDGIQTTAKGVYYLEFTRSGRALVVVCYDFAAKKSQPVVRFKNTNGFEGYSISPDGKFVLYSKVDQNETNLELVENFK